MKKLFCLFVFLFAIKAFAADAINVNEFSWRATRKDSNEFFTGSGKTTMLYKVIKVIQKVFDDKAKAGEIPDGTKFDVIVQWKKKEFKQTITAHSKYPIKR